MARPSDATPSLHDAGVYRESRERVTRLTPDAAAEWGEMSVTRMLTHCTEVQRVLNGGPLEGTPWYVKPFGPLIKRLVLGGNPFPKHARTHPQYEVTKEGDFETEKHRLLDALAEFRADGERELEHPLFGRLTADEAGWAAYKHLDHHLRQFGV